MRGPTTREGRSRAIMATVATVTVILLTAVHLCSALLPYFTTHLTLTEDTTFEVSQESLSYLDDLERDVTLSFICEGGRQDADPDLYAFLARYADTSSPNRRLRKSIHVKRSAATVQER